MTLTLVRTDRGLDGLTFSDRWNLRTLTGNYRPFDDLDHNATTRLRRRLARHGITLAIARVRDVKMGLTLPEKIAMTPVTPARGRKSA